MTSLYNPGLAITCLNKNLKKPKCYVMKVEYKEIIRIMIAFISLINTSFIFFLQYAQTGDYFGSVSTIFQPKIPDICLCQVQQIL